jgi:hypothetical protein
MKRSLFIVLTLAGFLIVYPFTAQSQPGSYRGGYGYGMGPGMMGGYGGYGMGYGGYGMMGQGEWVTVPTKLPTPKNTQWVQKLQEILVMEKDSLAQYEADQDKFNAFMPYMMVIPQEEYHVQWIGQLFAAYGLKPGGKTSSIVASKTLTDAYELSVKMENDLLPRYEWLIKNAEDRETAGILDTALIQSRIHLTMFDHALRVGSGYGFGMRRGFGRGYGYGMRGGYGMMGGYGYDADPKQYRDSSKPVDLKEAKAMMNDYLKSTRNPNLKVGKIKDIGNAFEAELLTKSNSVVDKIRIDKNTGWMRSAY